MTFGFFFKLGAVRLGTGTCGFGILTLLTCYLTGTNLFSVLATDYYLSFFSVDNSLTRDLETAGYKSLIFPLCATVDCAIRSISTFFFGFFSCSVDYILAVGTNGFGYI